MKKLLSLLAVLLVCAMSASAQDISFHGEEANCYADGPMYGGDIAGWGVPAIPGGNYGGQGYDTFCLVIEPEQCDMFAHVAGVRVDVNDGPINEITIKYLDGISGMDNFFMTITDGNDYPHIIGYVLAENPSGEEWKTVTFELPFEIPDGEVRYLRIEALGPIWSGCEDWGQLAIDYVEFDYNPDVPDFSTTAAIVAMVGGIAGLVFLRKRK